MTTILKISMMTEMTATTSEYLEKSRNTKGLSQQLLLSTVKTSPTYEGGPKYESGYAKVWFRQLGDQDVVVKQVSDQSLYLMEKNMLKAMGKVDNVVQMLYSEDSNLLLVFPFKGPDLFEKFVNSKEYVKEEEVKRVVRQIVMILRDLKVLGFKHGDVKPENFLIDENGSVTLIDVAFGSELKNVTAEHGTRSYMAPEVNKVGHRVESDVWSLGVLMFVLLFKCFPDPDRITDTTYLPEIYLDHPREPVSSLVETLIVSMLQVVPEKRPTFAEVLADDWFRSDTPRMSPKQVCKCIGKRKRGKIDSKIDSKKFNPVL